MQSWVCRRVFLFTITRRFSARVNKITRQVNKNRDFALNVPPPLSRSFLKYLQSLLSGEKNPELDTRLTIPEELNNPSLQTTEGTEVYHISSIIDQIHNIKTISDYEESALQLYAIDKEICRMMQDLSFDQILVVFNKLMEIVPHKISELNAYSKGMERLRNLLKKGSITSDKIVNMLFLAGLAKNAAARQVGFVFKHLPDLEELSLIEKCIVSMVTFKTGIKLNRKNVQVIEDTIYDNLDLLMSEPGLIVSLLKPLRYAGPSPGFSITPISKRILESKSSYRISLAVPILALYAEMLEPDWKAVKRLVGDSISDINRWRSEIEPDGKSKYFKFVRTKDVDRLLWAISTLDYKLNAEQLNDLEKFVDSRLSTLSRWPKSFSKILLYLWILKSPRCRETVLYCFKENVFEPLLRTPEDDQARLHLLIECVRIEAPEIEIPSVFDIDVPQQPIKTCHELETIGELIKCLGPHLALDDTQVDCPVQRLRIYGISTRHALLGWIHIDILNNVTCLKGTRQPHGMMNLKLRLIKAMGYFTILLENDGAINIESMIATIEERINSELNKLKC